MSSAMLQLQQVIVDALKDAPGLAGGSVYANRTRPVSAQETQSIVVRISSAEGSEIVTGSIDWRTSFNVECMAAIGGAGVDPAQSVDTLLEAVWARIAILQSDGFGLMGFDMEPEITWSFEEGATPLAMASIRITARHRTASSSLAPMN